MAIEHITTELRVSGRDNRRWVVLAEDGRYAILGRSVAPSEQDIQLAEDGLKRQGVAGWLALMSGSEYAARLPAFLEVRPLAGPQSGFAEAVEAWRLAVRGARH